MQTNSEQPLVDDGDENVLMIDRYQMGRIHLKEFFIRDQFAEERHPLGTSKVYFWQHRAEDGCTVKVLATSTDSNESAHAAMDHFISNLTNPSLFVSMTKEIARSHWFSKTEIENVQFLTSGDKQIAAILIWGNIFFHIQSSGEQDHSIEAFIDSLQQHWVHMRPDKKLMPDFKLTASKTELKVGEEATLSQIGPKHEQAYNSFIYLAGPKRLVDLYQEGNVFKLKIKPAAANALIAPSAILLGVRPDGNFIKSERIKFTIVPN